MNELLRAIKQEDNTTFTENGMATNKSSLDANVDLYFKIGASRGKNIISEFSRAFREDAIIATRIALWARDVRGGAGERQLFRDIVRHLAKTDVALAQRVLSKVPELGRWDDLYTAFGTPVEQHALRMIAKALNNGDGLCAKWQDRKGPNANKVRAYMKLTPKQYRKRLVELTRVVETQMCSNNWTEIEYGKVPSVASARYQKAFGRHDPIGYGEYISSLEKGEAKINASAVYPYTVVQSLKSGNERVANAQWNALPNYMEHCKETILPLVDVSGSMDQSINGERGRGSVTCMDVAISLGLYISERAPGPFKDHFITFHSHPTLESVHGSLRDRYLQMKGARWGGNTDFMAAFDLILDAAVNHNVSAEHMPTMFVVLSDMQFDEADRGFNATALKQVENKFARAGYKMPKMVFWNLRASTGVPATVNDRGVALISGFSPSIMASVFNAKHITPLNVMLTTISDERYNF